MESLSDTKYIKFNLDTLEVVRKDINLNQPGRIANAVDILENWVKMQAHFNKKDFSREYLERQLIPAKGLVERAKEALDKLCTFRTLMPEFFTISDAKKEFSSLQGVMSIAHMPRLTKEHYRVYVSKVISEENLKPSMYMTFYKYLTMLCEYFNQHEYSAGFVVILDYSDVSNILSMVTKVNPLELRQIINLMMEGYGLRIKGIHIITPSKMVETLVLFLKQIFSEKLAGRICTHKSVETIYEYVPKEILPVDYGGDEPLLADMFRDWIDEISSVEFLAYFNEMLKGNTDESRRQTNTFNENYIGVPGSFRVLSVD